MPVLLIPYRCAAFLKYILYSDQIIDHINFFCFLKTNIQKNFLSFMFIWFPQIPFWQKCFFCGLSWFSFPHRKFEEFSHSNFVSHSSVQYEPHFDKNFPVPKASAYVLSLCMPAPPHMPKSLETCYITHITYYKNNFQTCSLSYFPTQKDFLMLIFLKS